MGNDESSLCVKHFKALEALKVFIPNKREMLLAF